MGTELTNFFLIFRDRFGKEKEGTSIVATINVISFFLTYTVLRIAMLPAVEWHMIYRLWTGLNRGDLPIEYKLCVPTIVILFGLIIGLNFFWYSFILRGAKKLAIAGNTSGIGVKGDVDTAKKS